MLKILTLKQGAEWDAMVKSFHDYDAYWLSGYVSGFRIHGDGEPMLFFYNDDSCRAINVVMKRDVSECLALKDKIPKAVYYDFSTPYGYGGWLIEGYKTDDLIKEYDTWCRENGIISEFVRFHPVVGNHEQLCDFYQVTALGNVVCMDIRTYESIFQNLTSKNRNMIRKAKNNGIQILHGDSPDLFEQFKIVYESTMRSVGAKPYYFFEYEYYRSVCSDLKDNAKVFYALKDGRFVSGSIMLCANGKMSYHLSGTLDEYRPFAPGNLLLYEAARWGSKQGATTLYLGGGVGSENDGLYRFKKGFYRGGPLRFYIGKKIFNEKVYRKLVKESGVIEDSGFFPLYRA